MMMMMMIIIIIILIIIIIIIIIIPFLYKPLKCLRRVNQLILLFVRL